MTRQTTLARLMRAMIKYDGGDVPRIQHFVKVHDFARTIGVAEGLAETGGFDDAETERICWLIAHHHTYTGVVSKDHRILLEADFLVNSFEDQVSKEGIIAFRDNVFRSESAISMLNDMWGLSSLQENHNEQNNLI